MFITGQQDVNDADADEQGDKAEEEEEEEEEEEVIICFHFITTTVSLADCWLKEDKLLKWQIQIFKWSGGGGGGGGCSSRCHKKRAGRERWPHNFLLTS